MDAKTYAAAQCHTVLKAMKRQEMWPSQPGLQLIHVDVGVEPRTVYPQGNTGKTDRVVWLTVATYCIELSKKAGPKGYCV